LCLQKRLRRLYELNDNKLRRLLNFLEPAVVPLLPPVIVSPTDKFLESDTVAVIVPTGYVSTAEVLESWAKVCENCRIVHKLMPRFAQSAIIRLRDLRAVVAS
jgi:hypothetical protein